MDSVTIMGTKGPTIMVHRGWRHKKTQQNEKKRNQRRESIAASSPLQDDSEEEKPTLPTRQDAAGPKRPAPQREMAFVNITNPSRNKDQDLRKFVKSHVMKENARGKRQQHKAVKDRDLTTVQPPTYPQKELVPRVSFRDGLHTQTSLLSLRVGMELDLRIKAPSFDTDPWATRLANLYLSDVVSAMFPMESHLAFNPIRTNIVVEWAIHDDAVWHAMLYTSAICCDLKSGQGEKGSPYVIMQRQKAIASINHRLAQSPKEISEQTINAVACLAIGEVGDLHLSFFESKFESRVC